MCWEEWAKGAFTFTLTAFPLSGPFNSNRLVYLASFVVEAEEEYLEKGRER